MNERFIILADVTCDLSDELRERFDIDYIPGHMTLPSGEEVATTCDWKRFDCDEFYKDLKKHPTSYSTAPSSPEEIKQHWDKYLKEGKDIIALTISSALSGTYNFYLQAMKESLQEYPERKIHVIDSLRYSTALGQLCVFASILREEGKSFDEVVNWIEGNKNRFHQIGFLDDLSFVASKGRISKPKAFMGQLVGVKPLGELSSEGLTTVLANVTGDKKAIATMIEYMKQTIVEPEKQIIFVATTARLKQALETKKLVEETFKPKEVILNRVFPCNAINVGPGLMAVYYYGSETSKDLVKEKEIINNIIKK